MEIWVAATARDTATINDLAATYTDQVQLLQVDVTDENQVVDAINQAHKHFGRLDVVLGNAGYGAIEEASVDNARSNVLGTLLVVQATKPFLREHKLCNERSELDERHMNPKSRHFLGQ